MAVTETVAAQYRATLYDTPLPDLHTVTDCDIGSQSTVLAELCSLTDDTSWTKHNACANFYVRLDNTVGPDRD